jgi:hypothetical protein
MTTRPASQSSTTFGTIAKAVGFPFVNFVLSGALMLNIWALGVLFRSAFDLDRRVGKIEANRYTVEKAHEDQNNISKKFDNSHRLFETRIQSIELQLTTLRERNLSRQDALDNRLQRIESELLTIKETILEAVKNK